MSQGEFITVTLSDGHECAVNIEEITAIEECGDHRKVRTRGKSYRTMIPYGELIVLCKWEPVSF